MKKLPKQIYVTLEKDDDNYFLLADEKADNLNPEQPTGIYELKETGTIINKIEFVSN